MASVGVNPPKTPVTKGSNGIAAATIPNICKMPGAPPFVPTPLPNIGQSGKQPQGYSKRVKIEGHTVAIQGAMFGSTGDIASKATGGGIISSNAEGPTKFLGPGSLDVKIEGKNVQLLGDPMFNNCGPTGSPPNAATMAGVVQWTLLPPVALSVATEVQHICDIKCECQAAGRGQECISKKLDAEDRGLGRQSKIKSEVPYDMSKTPPQPWMKEREVNGSPLAGPLRPSRNWYRPHRRPDAVIVDNPLLPPYGSNIKAVVEIKLKDDPWRPGQLNAYQRIAGGKDNLIVINELTCECPDEEPEKVPEPVAVPRRAPATSNDDSRASGLRPATVALGAVAAVAAAVALVAAAPVTATAAAAIAVFGFVASGTNVASGGADVI